MYHLPFVYFLMISQHNIDTHVLNHTPVTQINCELPSLSLHTQTYAQTYTLTHLPTTLKSSKTKNIITAPVKPELAGKQTNKQKHKYAHTHKPEHRKQTDPHQKVTHTHLSQPGECRE